MHKLDVNEAVAEFLAILVAELGPETAARSGAEAVETAAEAEARYFRCAEALLRLACPEPTLCTDPRCRRGGLCRHLADLRARGRSRHGRQATRRTPGAAALRHAIWVFMNRGPGHGEADQRPG